MIKIMSDEKQIILRVAEQFIKTGIAEDKQVKVTCLPDNKTSCIEYDGDDGRSVMLDEYCLDGHIIWAGYSTRTQTVYLSAVNRRS